MGSNLVFTHTEDEILPVLEELRRREPIFHSPEFGTSTADYERGTAPDYWEVGASGRRYSRDFILYELYGKPLAFADSLGWKSWDHALRRLGPDTYLINYVLQKETASPAEPQSGKALMMGGAFSTTREQWFPWRKTIPVRRPSNNSPH